MIDLVKAAANVGVKRPLLAAPGDGPPDRLQRVVRRQPGPEPVARGQEVGFEDRLEHDPRRRHHHPVGDTWNTERPQLAWFARLRDVNPAQRPRPVGPGAQPRGELVEEHAHPRVHDVVDGDPIDARGSAVGTDLAPSPPEHVAAGDLVIEGVEAAILVLLGTAVEHALESTNPVHALGATDGPSRDGTHQSPSHPPCASMKRGPLPMRPAFPTSEYYDPLRPPLGRPPHFPGSPVIGGASLPSPRRRRGRDGSPGFPGRPSARSTPNTPEGSSAPAPGTRAPSMAFAVREPARLPLFPAPKRVA